MKKTVILGTLLCCTLMCLLSCTTDDVAGNGTRIGNPAIVGKIYKPDGKTPASKAAVFLRKKNSLPEIGLMKREADVTVVTTGDDGTFEIDSVESGTYVIECKDEKDNYSLYDSVQVENAEQTVSLPSDTLKPAGAIGGTIILPANDDFSKVYVLVFGVQRFSVVDDAGHFLLDNLGEGRYSLRIISTLDNIATVDTAAIAVVSAETTSLTVEMLYNGVPGVKNLHIVNYDTSGRVAALAWNTIDTSLIRGFIVYRKATFVPDNFLLMGLKNREYQTDTFNAYSPVSTDATTDTLFRDSSMLQNMTYTYKVTALGKDGEEGAASDTVGVTAVTNFSADTLFTGDFGNLGALKGLNPKKFILQNNVFYIVTHNSVCLYDTLFNRIGALDNLPGRPYEIAADGEGRIYVSIAKFTDEYYPDELTTILAFEGNSRVKRINLADAEDSMPALGIEALLFTVSNNGNIIFVNNTKDSIHICDSAGSIIRTIGTGVETGKSGGMNYKTYEGITTLATDDNNHIYVYLADRGVVEYTAEGLQVRAFDTPGAQLTSKIYVDPRNGNICLFSNYLVVFSPAGRRITGYSLQNGESHDIVAAGNTIYSLAVEYGYNETGVASMSGSVLKLINNLP